MSIASHLTSTQHPLDPLSPEEIEAAVALLRESQGLGRSHRFVTVELREPEKHVVQAHGPGDAIERDIFAVVLDNETRQVFESVVSLNQRRVASFDHVPGVQPSIMLDEFGEVEEACKADQRFRDALAERGVTDLDLVCVEPWSAGYYGEEDNGRRLMRCLVYTRLTRDDNPYAHPVDNLVPVVDLNEMRIVRLEDYGVVPVPAMSHNYTPADVGAMRTDVRPIEISQPDGPSFEITGHQIRWQKWELRIGFTPREGLVLHDVRYRDGNRWRPVLYRASLSEMVVPYGEPTAIQYRKNAFDAGEYNIGTLANSLELGCDCLGEIRYFDAAVNDSYGRARILRNAVCVHEEDAGLLWKHTDFRTGAVEVRRRRRLTLSFIATVANYEYAFYWYLYQDGTIEFEVKLTGILSTAALPPGERTDYGQMLNADGLYAPIHQHLFNVRLDLDVDGPHNAVYETEIEVPDNDNPYGNAFLPQKRLLETELQARRDIEPGRVRSWKIVNHRRLNAVGEPVAYRLVPSGSVPAFQQAQSHVARRAGFTRHHLWVTPYERGERYAAGDYPNQSRGGEGLPTWTAKNRHIVDEDVVIWHTMGTNHVVRLEDWPVMPVQHVGFKLEPSGFFDCNPALDVPPERRVHCAHAHAAGNGHGTPQTGNSA